jgi:uracil-DNA glycosylase
MSWHDSISFFGSEEYTRILTHIVEARDAGKVIHPEPDQILRALELTPLDNVKVVILGQDPYPTPGTAHGLAFSVQVGTNPPASLNNIFAELKSDLGCERGWSWAYDVEFEDGGATPITSDIKQDEVGCLEDWASQGVLLLNTALTVESGAPGSHSDLGWSGLTNEIIRVVSQQREHVVFILWGKHAQSKITYIRNKPNHLILTATHPSPRSAYRGFFGCRHFSKANAFLEKHDEVPICWCGWIDACKHY